LELPGRRFPSQWAVVAKVKLGDRLQHTVRFVQSLDGCIRHYRNRDSLRVQVAQNTAKVVNVISQVANRQSGLVFVDIDLLG
jgi:hypothetical protein